MTNKRALQLVQQAARAIKKLDDASPDHHQLWRHRDVWAQTRNALAALQGTLEYRIANGQLYG